MNVAFLTSEAVPFVKTGGLADVAGALPRFLKRLNVDVRVVLPFYKSVKDNDYPLKKIIDKTAISWKGKSGAFSAWEYAAGDFPVYFIQGDHYFDRDFLYGTSYGDYPDNGERFAFFARASLELLKSLGFKPDILHGHDWQAAAAFAYLRFVYGEDPFFRQIKSLFTIHNLAYQGLFEKEILERIGLPGSLFRMEDLEFYGKINFLKAGILYSSAVSTVSPRYSQEIQTPEFGCGLDDLLRTRSDRLFGILNGVDYGAWNPETDPALVENYSARSVAGKAACKLDLLETFGLAPAKPGVPLIGIVSRLAGQKGIDLVAEALGGIFESGAKLIVLGTGEDKIEKQLLEARKKYPHSLGLKIGFDEFISHKIIGGCDLFLIPSRYEPCGLTQMYSLKYGTIPVVRATGGLEDSVREFDPGSRSGNGFKFGPPTSAALLDSLRKALALTQNKDLWPRLIRNAMAADFSWERAARYYLELYRVILSA
jgi:starch synthase